MSATAPCVWATARVANLAWSHCTHPTTVDTIVSGDIQTNGCFECESVAAILTTMRQQRPSLLVDIGGNIGMYTAAAATQGHRVHTYEPVPTNAARIRETLRRNRLEQRVTLYEACLGPAPGWAALGKNATNQGGIRHELVASGADPGADRHLVPVVSLDTQPPPPADLNVFIKMDIEGSECGGELLRRRGPRRWAATSARHTSTTPTSESLARGRVSHVRPQARGRRSRSAEREAGGGAAGAAGIRHTFTVIRRLAKKPIGHRGPNKAQRQRGQSVAKRENHGENHERCHSGSKKMTST